jgi:hypothetical protein
MSAAFCKVDGCTREARWTRGMYAGLCEEHMQEKALSRPQSVEAKRRDGNGLEPELVKLARRLIALDQERAGVIERMRELIA